MIKSKNVRFPDDVGTKARNIMLLEVIIAAIAIVGCAAHLILRYVFDSSEIIYNLPLYVALLVGGVPLVLNLSKKLLKGEYGSDLLAGISILAAALLGEYLAGVIIVLMLSGGASLESFAIRRSSSALQALARRMPSVAHKRNDTGIDDVELDEVRVDDRLVVYPHETCPVDGVVMEGHSVMDESFLTGEPYEMPKTPGSEVISGSVNGEYALTIRAVRVAGDSRYAKIMEVMRESEQRRPRLRRLGDRIGAWYTPLAISIALIAWAVSGDPVRFLATLVIATPCPLLIAIPVAVIGAISLAARRSIIIRDPAALEQIDNCRTIILDKTGTLTYGKPTLTDEIYAEGFHRNKVLAYAAAIERYSKHPLAEPIRAAARKYGIELLDVEAISERPGKGIRGTVDGHVVRITGRNNLLNNEVTERLDLPSSASGLECIILVDGVYAATYRFHDAPRLGTKSFIEHLFPHHRFEKTMIVSGDRAAEVQYLADEVGIDEIHAEKSPEEKVQIVRAETSRATTLFVGDGINDAPAMVTATVGVAFGQSSDVTAEAAKAVVMGSSFWHVDELFHISGRFKRIALQSALGGMGLSIIGMFVAAFGYLPPVAGAIGQEIIDLLAVANALRVGFIPKSLTDD